MKSDGLLVGHQVLGTNRTQLKTVVHHRVIANQRPSLCLQMVNQHLQMILHRQMVHVPWLFSQRKPKGQFAIMYMNYRLIAIKKIKMH